LSDLRAVDPWRIWDDPPKGHDAADVEAEGLGDRMLEALQDESLVDPPRELEWWHGNVPRRVLVQETLHGWVAWVFRRRQEARWTEPVCEGLEWSREVEQALAEKAGLSREQAAPKTGSRRRREPPDPAVPDDGGLPWGHLDMEQVQMRYQLGRDGIVPMRWDGRSKGFVPSPNSRLVSRPMWPERAGYDQATGTYHWELGWIDPWGRTVRSWLHEADIRHGSALIDLPASPVTDGKQRLVAEWLEFATQHVTRELVTVYSRAGWVAVDGELIWAWPAESVNYIGPELHLVEGEEAKGRWIRGVDTLIEHGDRGLPALAALAISAAAPLARLHGHRNPILGYSSRTSRGKGSALGYACSLWCRPDMVMAPASSTSKGIQDLGNRLPDLPCWLDELQQLLDQGDRGRGQAMDSLYYLANGVRRVTSSKAQSAVGGERRYGCGMYAAESTVLEGLHAGVQSRVVEIGDDPCPDAPTANALQDAARAAGAWSRRLIEVYQLHRPAVLASRVERWADGLRADQDEHDPLRGEDCDTVAMLCLGLQLLGEALDRDLPVAELEEYLLGKLRSQRRRQVDRELDGLQRVLSFVLGAQGWKHEGTPAKRGPPDEQGFPAEQTYVCRHRDGILGWRRSAVTILNRGGRTQISEHRILRIEIAPGSPMVQQLLEQFGGRERLLGSWDARGWLRKDGANRTVKKTWQGRAHGRVIALTPAALEEAGVAVVEPDEEEEFDADG